MNMIMLERKFTSFLTTFLKEEPNKILLVNGARQIGKSSTYGDIFWQKLLLFG